MSPVQAFENQPNVLVILCDDLGIGDVQCFNPEGKIKTPRMNLLASQGMSFTDAHSGSSVCTPTRYGLLTGRYSWRTKFQHGVVQGFEACLIAPDRTTLPGFLKSQGYHTGLIGKWHLNMKFTDPDDSSVELAGKPFKFTPPVGATSPDGPIHRGFDYFYGTHHARSMKAIIEQDKVTKHDDVINFLPSLEKKSIAYIQERAKSKQPFFLFLALGSPHTPIVPTEQWQGKSGLGEYADFVMQTDDVIGNVLDSLDANQLTDNTLVILSSDNGCSRAAKIGQLAKKGHHVSAQFRGSKADIWEGGHRVPFVVRWPGVVKPNSKSEQLIGLNDLFATIAESIDQPVPDNTCEDSVSFFPALKGEKGRPRESIIHHSISGHFAYRTTDWKLILAKASGGWSAPKEKNAPADWPEAQLYYMQDDSEEKQNVYLSQPETASELLNRLTADVVSGRSTPGPTSQNDIDDIRLWKSKK